MRKKPSGTDLVGIADQTEAAADPNAGNARYVAAMIRNARAIAKRQSAAGDAPAVSEAASLNNLLDTQGSLEDMNRALAQAIRDGRAPRGTHAHLTAVNRSDMAESNPRYLEKLGT